MVLGPRQLEEATKVLETITASGKEAVLQVMQLGEGSKGTILGPGGRQRLRARARRGKEKLEEISPGLLDPRAIGLGT